MFLGRGVCVHVCVMGGMGCGREKGRNTFFGVFEHTFVKVKEPWWKH